MSDIIEKIIVAEVPKVLPNQQLHVYVPVATYNSPGIASFDSTYFNIRDNKVYFKDSTITEMQAELDDKLDMKNDVKVVYATDSSGNQVVIGYSTLAANTIVKRSGNEILVPSDTKDVTNDNGYAASRAFVREKILENIDYTGHTLEKGNAEGSIEIVPYTGRDDETGVIIEVSAVANAEGAMAFAEDAEAKGKRSKVFAKRGKTGEKAWDAVLVGQETESNASGNFTGGLGCHNYAPYGITYGKHCHSGVNAQNEEQFDGNGEPYKNSPIVNLGSHNAVMASNDDTEHAKVAIGDGLLVRNQSGRQAYGKYNADKDGVWFEFGGGYYDSENKQSVRKNVFDIKNNNTFRHYGDVTFARDAAAAKGEVSFDITSVDNGANIWLKFPKKSGTLALAEDVQGGGGAKLYRHIIKATTRDNNHDGHYEVTYIFDSISATPITSSQFLPPAGALASYKAVVSYGGYTPTEEYGIGAFNQTTEFGTPYFIGFAVVSGTLVQRNISFEWEGYDSFEDIVEVVRI